MGGELVLGCCVSLLSRTAMAEARMSGVDSGSGFCGGSGAVACCNGMSSVYMGVEVGGVYSWVILVLKKYRSG